MGFMPSPRLYIQFILQTVDISAVVLGIFHLMTEQIGNRNYRISVLVDRENIKTGSTRPAVSGSAK